MIDYILHLADVLVIGLFIFILYWVVGNILKKLFNIQISNETGIIISIIGGFVISRMIT